MSDLRATLAGLSDEERRELLTRLRRDRQQQQPPVRARPTAGLAPRGGPMPLSAAQERMWFLEQFRPGSAVHVMSGAARLPVTVPVEIFAECLEEVVARHEALRTRFHARDGAPVAIVGEGSAVAVEFLGDVAREQMWQQFAEAARRPFDIAGEPLVRAALAHTTDGECYAQVTLHHLVSDGFSTGILFQELSALCTGRLLGQRPVLPPVPYHYADFAAWQEGLAGAPGFAERLQYWQDHLRDAPRVLALPEDRPRPAEMSLRGARREFRLSAAELARVRAGCRARGVTPFVAMLAAYAVTLSRWSAQDGVVVGVPVAQREAAGSDRVVGPFLNTVALHVDLAGDPTAAELLDQTHRTVRQGFAHQDVPWDRVLGALAVARDPSRSPLFQVVLNVQEDRSSRDLDFRDLHNGTAQFDLLLNLTLSEHGATGIVDYAADLFDAATVDAFIDTFRTVLLALPDRLELPVSTLPVTTEPLVLAAPTAPLGDHQTLHDAILDAARRHPGRTALVTGTGTISYAELDRRTADVARDLRRRTPPGAAVGVFLPRCAETVLAFVGILRAGCSFVPLDPSYPEHRIRQICEDADLAAILTTAEHLGRAPAGAAPVVDLATTWAADRPAPVDAPAATAAPAPAAPAPAVDGVDGDSCAYQIYTSGSTGRPKGVRVSHRNVVTFCAAVAHTPGMTGADTLLAVTSPSFDISILELLLPLTLGARIVIATAEQAADPGALQRLLADHDVTVMQATPATWHLLVDAGWSGRHELRALCGGEAMPPALAAALLPRTRELWNMYGPTETTIWSLAHRVTAEDLGRGTIPLGVPLHGTGLAIVDPDGRAVPDGMHGELCLTGAGVSLGYHARDELTRDRFVTLTASDGTRARAYRTGDLVRRRPGGRIEFGGRIDLQVKVRGFRIELGEVETALEELVPGLRAIAVADAATDALLAFLEAPPGVAVPTAAQLRRRLLETLPGHMVPSRIGLVDALPLTPNGKVDRNALAARPVAGPDRDADDDDAQPGDDPGTAPRTELERRLAEIWTELLGLDRTPGVAEDFFLIGGHSLLATRLVFRIRDVLGQELPLPVLFGGPLTIARLAQILSSPDAAPAAGGALDLAAEAVLDDAIRPGAGAHVHSSRHPQRLLVTGATGFVGGFLVDQLMRDTRATLFCLVRADTRAEGLDRIRRSMTGFEIWHEEYAERIVVVLGTLARPRLGLSRPAWHHLAAVVDGIVHCGAEVNFLRSYESLKAANVVGTQEVLRLAAEGSVKPVHLISTTYVFSRFAYPPSTEFLESGMDPVHDLEHTFGYTQSKWVAEQLAFAARDRGIPVSVYRTGRVAGHSATGACQLYDFVWQVTRLGIEMGVAPVMDMAVDITPVDYVVAAIVQLARQPELAGETFHVVSPEPLQQPDLVAWMERYGYRGERTTFAQWCARVVERGSSLDDDTATALAPFLSGTLPLDRIPPARFDDSAVQQGLVGSGIVCPPIDGTLLRRYFDWFVAQGFLPPPDPAGAEPTVRETPEQIRSTR